MTTENKIGFQRNHGHSFSLFFGKKLEFCCIGWSYLDDLKVKSLAAHILPIMRIEYRPSALNYASESSMFSVLFGFLFWFIKFTIIKR